MSCQRAHWRKHKKECRKKYADTSQRDGHNNASDINVDDVNMGLGAMNISDDKLFQDPPPKEDCPICFLPMPYTSGLCGVGVSYNPCRGKLVCSGCIWASVVEMQKGNLKSCCAFCREPIESIKEDGLLSSYNKRMEAGDADAFFHMGSDYELGDRGLPQDHNKAMEMWNRGADLGHAGAHHSIADAYLHGEGVEKDDKKAKPHLELDAMGGHEMARYSIGINEYNDGNMNRAMRHFMIAARAGYDDPLKWVGDGYKWGIVTKDEYESTLRAHKDSQDEMKVSRDPQLKGSERQEKAQGGLCQHD